MNVKYSNIIFVDQIFIANANYLGSYGNAANTVVFPLTVIAIAIAVMVGDGCCAFVSISLGEKNTENASKSMGNSIMLTVISSFILTAIYLTFCLCKQGYIHIFASHGKSSLINYAFYGA